MFCVTEIKDIDKKRVLITLDEYFQFPLYKGESYKLSIREDICITQEQLDHIMNDILLKRAKERALYILKSSDKTEKQLKDKLSSGYYPEEIINKVITFLKEYKYIDDLRYAKTYIGFKSSKKSLFIIKNELYKKGISNEVFSIAWDETYEEKNYDPCEPILKELEKKKIDPEKMNEKEKIKIINYLLRKGHKYDNIIESIKKINKNRDVNH